MLHSPRLFNVASKKVCEKSPMKSVTVRNLDGKKTKFYCPFTLLKKSFRILISASPNIIETSTGSMEERVIMY